MRKHLILLAVPALTVGAQAMAADTSYNYAQVDLRGTRISGGGDSDNGFGAGFDGSLQLMPHLFALVGYGTSKYSDDTYRLRFTPASLGAGGYVALSPTVDFFGSASYEHMKLKFWESGFGGFTRNFHGWGVAVGARGVISDKAQWNLSLRHRDLGDLNSIVGVSGGIRYYQTPHYAVGLEITRQKYDELHDKETIAQLTFRYDFDSRR